MTGNDNIYIASTPVIIWSLFFTVAKVRLFYFLAIHLVFFHRIRLLLLKTLRKEILFKQSNTFLKKLIGQFRIANYLYVRKMDVVLLRRLSAFPLIARFCIPKNIHKLKRI